MIPVGKFVAIPLAGYLVSKLGSRTMVQVSILGYAMSLLCVGLAHEVYLLGFLLFCFGVFWNLCDISFNTQGIEVERLYGKTIDVYKRQSYFSVRAASFIASLKWVSASFFWSRSLSTHAR